MCIFSCVAYVHIKSAAKLQKIFDICKKKSKIFGSDGDFCVSVVSRSSLGCESVESWRSGDGDGNELTNERENE